MAIKEAGRQYGDSPNLQCLCCHVYELKNSFWRFRIMDVSDVHTKWITPDRVFLLFFFHTLKRQHERGRLLTTFSNRQLSRMYTDVVHPWVRVEGLVPRPPQLSHIKTCTVLMMVKVCSRHVAVWCGVRNREARMKLTRTLQWRPNVLEADGKIPPLYLLLNGMLSLRWGRWGRGSGERQRDYDKCTCAIKLAARCSFELEKRCR